jgi:hypothetical protein
MTGVRLAEQDRRDRLDQAVRSAPLPRVMDRPVDEEAHRAG